MPRDERSSFDRDTTARLTGGTTALAPSPRQGAVNLGGIVGRVPEDTWDFVHYLLDQFEPRFRIVDTSFGQNLRETSCPKSRLSSCRAKRMCLPEPLGPAIPAPTPSLAHFSFYRFPEWWNRPLQWLITPFFGGGGRWPRWWPKVLHSHGLERNRKSVSHSRAPLRVQVGRQVDLR